jgi:hypothetical protein
MLPILRIIPVGGVFLAITILVLALGAPGSSRPPLSPAALPARGALLQRFEHPEWRQFLILAATRRADELNRLRDLPDTPATPKAGGKIAGLPVEHNDADPDDETGTIADMPSFTIPIEIGETSSTELPMTPPEEKSPAIRMPAHLKTPHETRKRPVHRIRHAKAPAKTEPVVTFNLLEALFGGLQANQSTLGRSQVYQPATVRADPQ